MVTQGATLSPEELVCVFFERVEQNKNEYAVLPYIRGLTEPLKRLLKRYDVKVISKFLRTLNQMLPSPKTDHQKKNKRTLFIKLIALIAHELKVHWRNRQIIRDKEERTHEKR